MRFDLTVEVSDSVAQEAASALDPKTSQNYQTYAREKRVQLKRPQSIIFLSLPILESNNDRSGTEKPW